MHPFYKNDGFQFAVEGALGNAYYRATDVGEVLGTIARIPDGDDAAWVTGWSTTAERVAGTAREAEAAGHLRSAAARWLRACPATSSAARTGSDDERWCTSTAATARSWGRGRGARRTR
jgi:hypothetical protein